MTDSLTLSLLIFFAILVVLVLAGELWRLRGLGREKVRSLPRAKTEKPRAAAAPRGPSERQEPGFESLDLPTAARVEPDFPLFEGGVNPLGPADGGPAQTTLTPRAFVPGAVENPTPSARGTSVEKNSSVAPDRAQPSDNLSAAAVIAEGSEVSRSTVRSASMRARSAGLPKQAPSVPSPPDPEPAIEQSSMVETVPVIERGAPPVPADDPALASGPMLSMTTDCIVDLACPTPIPGERLASVFQGFRRCGTKPVMIEVPIPGATASSPRQWRAPLAGDNCRAVRIGILLDNRSGPLNAMEFSEFLARVEETAERLGAHYTAPQMSDVLLAARRLDTDCAQLDWNAGLNVDASEVLGPGQLAALAGPLLIVERGSNRYARLDERGDPVFSVSLGDRPNRLTFLLDLPRVHDPQDAWKQMVECALVAARRLPGRLVDDGGKPLGERFLESSAMQVHQRALALEAVGLKAGTASARRVFN